MTNRPDRSLATLVLLALIAGCQGDSGWLATEPTPPQTAVPAPIRFEPGGFSSSWEVVGVAGTRLSDHPFTVLAHDGKSIAVLPILWAVSGSGASITPAIDTTRNGSSTATLTLGSEEGRYIVTATAPTLPDAPQLTFKATAVTLMEGIRDLADGGFVPANVTVPSGRSVGWRHESAEGHGHNVTFEDDPTRPVSSGDMWDLWASHSYHSRLFEGPPRTIRYRCTYHSKTFDDGEVGTVTVK